MTMELRFEQSGAGFTPRVSDGVTGSWGLECRLPAALWLLLGSQPYIEASAAYQTVNETVPGREWRASAEFDGPMASRFLVEDRWVHARERIEVNRRVTVLAAGGLDGVQTRLEFRTDIDGGVDVRDFEYLAPCAFYKHLDTDGDGVPDNYQTYNLTWAEDKLSFPGVMIYRPEDGRTAAIFRADVASYDADVSQAVADGRRFFVHNTDVGSIGFRFDPAPGDPQVVLRAHYPFYEGEVSYALDRRGYPWGAYGPAEDGAVLECAWTIAMDRAQSFPEACWKTYKSAAELYRPLTVELPYSFETVNAARLDYLNSCYFEKRVDGTVPAAGYAVNCHPLEGRTLAHVFEYGFSGKQLMNAYVCLRYGYEQGDAKMLEQARKVVAFFNEAVVQDNGFCHGLYDADREMFVPWFTGILLPYSFATSRQEEEQYLGKETVAGLETITSELKGIQGAFTRPMAEEGYSLLTCWELERSHGRENPEWLNVALRIGEFFLAIQDPDGSWYRAVDPEGQPLKVPEAWFGRSEDMRKSTVFNVVTFMVKLYTVTGDDRFLQAAVAGADFGIASYVETSYMYGTLLDHPFNGSMRATGPIMDNVSPMFALEALLDLFDVTHEDRFKSAALKAGQIAATWVNLWDVPWPAGSTLDRFNFRSTGWSPVNTYAASFQTDLYPLYFVLDFVRLAEITGDPGYLLVAELMHHAMNDMVSTDDQSYGYARKGLQNEGRVMSWFFIKEWGRPTDGEGAFEFAGRGKGEENKTAYAWMYAIPLANHFRLLDRYGTEDFREIKRSVAASSSVRIPSC